MKPASHEPGPCKFLAAVQRAGAGPQYSCLWWLQVLQVANSTAALQQPRRYGQTTCQYARTNYQLWLHRVGDIAVPGNWGPGALRKPDLKNCPTP